MKEIEERLSSLGLVADELNRVSDEATASLRSLEASLARMNLGVSAWTGEPFCFEHEPDLDDAGEEYSIYSGVQYALGYCKIGSAWRLAVSPIASKWACRPGEEPEVGSDETDLRVYGFSPIPLLDTAREVRFAAIAHLPELLSAIEESARDRIVSIRRAIRAQKERAQSQTELLPSANAREASEPSPRTARRTRQRSKSE
jgi:hypothetical protein